MKALLNRVATAAKAVAGAVVPLIGTSLVDGQVSWRSVLAAGAGALVVYFVPNAKPYVTAAELAFTPAAAGNPASKPPASEVVAAPPPATRSTDAGSTPAATTSLEAKP